MCQIILNVLVQAIALPANLWGVTSALLGAIPDNKVRSISKILFVVLQYYLGLHRKQRTFFKGLYQAS